MKIDGQVKVGERQVDSEKSSLSGSSCLCFWEKQTYKAKYRISTKLDFPLLPSCQSMQSHFISKQY